MRRSFYFLFLVSSEKTEEGKEEGAEEEEDEEVKVTTMGKRSLCLKHRNGE